MALRVSSITETDTSSKSDSKSKEHSQSQSRSDSQSTTKKLLDSDLMNQILGGLMRNMTDEEINQFAENLLYFETENVLTRRLRRLRKTCCGRSSTRHWRKAGRTMKPRS